MSPLGSGGGIANYRKLFLQHPPPALCTLLPLPLSLPCPLGAFMLPLEVLSPPQSHLSSWCATEKDYLPAWYHILPELMDQPLVRKKASSYF